MQTPAPKGRLIRDCWGIIGIDGEIRGRGFPWFSGVSVWAHFRSKFEKNPHHNPTAPLPDTHQNPYRSQGRSRAHQTHHQASPDRQMRHGGRAAGGRGRICRSGEAWWWVWWARLRPWLLYGSWWVSGRGAVGLWWGLWLIFDRTRAQTVTIQTPAPQVLWPYKAKETQNIDDWFIWPYIEDPEFIRLVLYGHKNESYISLVLFV